MCVFWVSAQLSKSFTSQLSQRFSLFYFYRSDTSYPSRRPISLSVCHQMWSQRSSLVYGVILFACVSISKLHLFTIYSFSYQFMYVTAIVKNRVGVSSWIFLRSIILGKSFCWLWTEELKLYAKNLSRGQIRIAQFFHVKVKEVMLCSSS